MLPLERKVSELQRLLSSYEQVLVCFSGGVDSSYLLAEAVRSLNGGAVAFTAVSPSLAPWEGKEAAGLARRLGARHLLVETRELDDPRYAANPVNRCYFCKTEVYGVAVEEARKHGIDKILDGFNRDDRGDHRPGRKAAREHGILSPLDEIGFGKDDIRRAAREIGVPVWDKPALACLSSRFPYGTEITTRRLEQVAECEAVLRDSGFRIFRVRYHDAVARIEVSEDELPRLLQTEVKEMILRRFRQSGFTYVSVDLQGYRTGSMNETVTGGRKIVQLEGSSKMSGMEAAETESYSWKLQRQARQA